MIPKKVLFCTDFSENSEPARQIAVDYSAAFGATLIILHVVNWGGLPFYGDWVGEPLDQIIEHAKKKAEADLEALAKQCGDLKGGIQTFCRTGRPAQEIVSLAQEQSADLIVVGSQGQSGARQLVMGSVARSVLRMAHRPVLIIEAPKKKGESFDNPS